MYIRLAKDWDTTIEIIQGSTFADIFRGTNADNILWRRRSQPAVCRVGNDILTGRGGNDSLSCQGDNATFVFGDGIGAVLVFDFHAFSNVEKVDLSTVTSIMDFADLQASHLTQNGAHAVITDGRGAITLLNVLVANLNANDFLF